jgi:lipopolysaccharide heptosyltransferase II
MQRRGLNQFRQFLISIACSALSIIFKLPILRGAKALGIKALPEQPRIVIIKPCCLGDVALSTPVIAALHELLPQAHLTFVVSKWARATVENNPHLEAIQDSHFNGSHFMLKNYLSLVKELRQAHYDLAIVLDRSPLLALLPWLAGIKHRAGLDSLGRGFALNYKAATHPNIARHEADVYLDVLHTLGITPPNPHLEFYPGEPAQLSLQTKTKQWGLDLNQPIVVIHPGGGQNPDTSVLAKRWPSQNFAEIALLLLKAKCQVTIIGAQTDLDAIQPLLATINSKTQDNIEQVQLGKLFDLSQQLSVAEIGALAQHAELFVGNDTGLMHIACACGPAVVAIFGPSSPIMYRPYIAKGRALSPVTSKVLSGLPLTEYQALSVEQGGISQVSVEQVWEAIQEVVTF